MNAIKQLWIKVAYQTKALELAKRELESAKRGFLEAQTHREFYDAQVQFERGRISRLEAYLKASEV